MAPFRHGKIWPPYPTGKGGRCLESHLFESICSEKRGVNPKTLEAVITLAVEIAREGREGRKVGTLFVVSDSQEVLKRSRSLILDPLFGHPDEVKSVEDPDMRETVKELAQLDGAFIVSDDGVVLSACRYISASAEGVSLPWAWEAGTWPPPPSPTRPGRWPWWFPKAPSCASSTTGSSSARFFPRSGFSAVSACISPAPSRKKRKPT